MSTTSWRYAIVVDTSQSSSKPDFQIAKVLFENGEPTDYIIESACDSDTDYERLKAAYNLPDSKYKEAFTGICYKEVGFPDLYEFPKQEIALTGEDITLPDFGKYHQTEFMQSLEEASAKAPLITCPKCEGVHFRHAGYLLRGIPIIEGEKSSLGVDEERVMLCVSCKHPITMIKGKIVDVSSVIDLKAWEKTEKEAHKATGPGGQC